MSVALIASPCLLYTSLGLTPFQTFVYILLPQSLKRVTPSVINLFTRMVKTSSLAMLIGVVEVIKVGQQIIEYLSLIHI